MPRKRGNICFGHKMFLTKIRNIFLFLGHKFCVRNKCCAHGQTFVSATLCPRLPPPLRLKICIKLTKLPKYYCNHKMSLSFYTYPGCFFRKYFMENVEKTVSKPLDFKEDAPTPPTSSRLRRSISSPPPPHYKIRSAVPAKASLF